MAHRPFARWVGKVISIKQADKGRPGSASRRSCPLGAGDPSPGLAPHIDEFEAPGKAAIVFRQRGRHVGPLPMGLFNVTADHHAPRTSRSPSAATSTRTLVPQAKSSLGG